jgi:hypothetical protein
VRTGLYGFVQELPAGEIASLPVTPLTAFPVSIETLREIVLFFGTMPLTALQQSFAAEHGNVASELTEFAISVSCKKTITTK